MRLMRDCITSVSGKEEERQMFQQMQAMAQKQVVIYFPYMSVCAYDCWLLKDVANGLKAI